MPLVSANTSFTVLFSVPFFFITTCTFMPAEGEAGPGFTFEAWRSECAFYWISTRYALCTCSNITFFMLFATTICIHDFQVTQTSRFTLLLMRVWKPIYLWLTWLMCLKRLSGSPSASLRCSQSMMLSWLASTPKAYVPISACFTGIVQNIHWHFSMLIMHFFHGVVCRKGPWRNCPWSSGKSIWGRGEDLSY